MVMSLPRGLPARFCVTLLIIIVVQDALNSLWIATVFQQVCLGFKQKRRDCIGTGNPGALEISFSRGLFSVPGFFLRHMNPYAGNLPDAHALPDSINHRCNIFREGPMPVCMALLPCMYLI